MSSIRFFVFQLSRLIRYFGIYPRNVDLFSDPTCTLKSQRFAISGKEETMQASFLSSDHGIPFCKSEGVLCPKRLPFKPNSPRNLKYKHTLTSCTRLSATLDSPCRANVISPPTTLTSRSRSSTGRFLPPILCSNSSNSLSANDDIVHSSGRSFRGWVEVVGETISTLFPIWVALGCFLGLMRPNSYNWVQPKWTMMGITFTMLGMGMTLTFDDLKGALAMPKELFTGFFLQYSVSSRKQCKQCT